MPPVVPADAGLLWVIHVPAGWHKALVHPEANSEISLYRDYISLLIFLTMFPLHFKESLCHFYSTQKSN